MQTPVIYLSAKNKDCEIEEGFLRGGDDYMTKSFNMNELILRIKSILKRTTKQKIIFKPSVVLDINYHNGVNYKEAYLKNM